MRRRYVSGKKGVCSAPCQGAGLCNGAPATAKERVGGGWGLKKLPSTVCTTLMKSEINRVCIIAIKYTSSSSFPHNTMHKMHAHKTFQGQGNTKHQHLSIRFDQLRSIFMTMSFRLQLLRTDNLYAGTRLHIHCRIYMSIGLPFVTGNFSSMYSAGQKIGKK